MYRPLVRCGLRLSCRGFCSRLAPLSPRTGRKGASAVEISRTSYRAFELRPPLFLGLVCLTDEEVPLSCKRSSQNAGGASGDPLDRTGNIAVVVERLAERAIERPLH